MQTKAHFHAGFLQAAMGMAKAVSQRVGVGADLALAHEVVSGYDEIKYSWDTNHLTILKPEAYATLTQANMGGITLAHELRGSYATMIGQDSQTFRVLGNKQTHDFRTTDALMLAYGLSADVCKGTRVSAAVAWSNQDFTQGGVAIQVR